MICCLDGHSGLACIRPGSLMCRQDHFALKRHKSFHLRRPSIVTIMAALKPLFKCEATTGVEQKAGAVQGG